MSANNRFFRIVLLLLMLPLYSTTTFAGWGGQSSIDGSGGVWREVHCETGTGWQKCQPPPCEAQGVTWGACSGSVPRTLLNGSVTVNNVTSGYSGSATYQCVDYELYSQWTYLSGSCVEDPPPPPDPPEGGGGTNPPSGTPIYVSAFICGSSQAGYYSGPSDVSIAWKTQIINAYKNFNIGGRCPELGGYQYWQSDLSSRAASLGWSAAWDIVFGSMMTNAAANGENSMTFINTYMKNFCTVTAQGIYGPGVTAHYEMYSGNLCRID